MSVHNGAGRAGERPGLLILAVRVALGLSLIPIVVLVAAVGGLGLLGLTLGRIASRTSGSIIPAPDHRVIARRARLTP